MSEAWNKPPPAPWEVGVQEKYTATSLTVSICQDQFDRVWSGHHFSSPEAEEAALALPQGGVKQIAFGLLVEALRRELFVEILVALSQNGDYIAKWSSAEAATQRNIEREIGATAQQVMSRTIEKMAPDCAREVLTMLSPTPPLQTNQGSGST